MDNSKIDAKQILILSLLVGVLVIVVCVNYLIRPVYSDAVKYNEDTAKLEESLEEMKTRSTTFGINQVDFNNNQKLLTEKTKNLMKLKKRNDLGTQITDAALSKDLSVTNLRLGEIEEYKVVLPFEEKMTENSNDEDESAENETVEETITGPDMSLYPGAVLLYDENEEEYSLQYKTGEYSCYIECSVKGQYSQIQKFVSEIASDPSMGITSFKMNNEDTNSDSTRFSASISIKVNMAGDIPDMSYQGAGADENS